jgi:hypothetical protein
VSSLYRYSLRSLWVAHCSFAFFRPSHTLGLAFACFVLLSFTLTHFSFSGLFSSLRFRGCLCVPHSGACYTLCVYIFVGYCVLWNVCLFACVGGPHPHYCTFFAFAFAFAAVVEPDTGADPMVRIVKEFLGDEVTPDLEEVILSAATSFRETAVE